ncbi:hypothetical protein JCM11641_000344 [Rhodosporidiobolus odoratus]
MFAALFKQPTPDASLCLAFPAGQILFVGPGVLAQLSPSWKARTEQQDAFSHTLPPVDEAEGKNGGDEEKADCLFCTPEPTATLPSYVRCFAVTDYSYTAYRTLLCYAYSGSIAFAPLNTVDVPDLPSATYDQRRVVAASIRKQQVTEFHRVFPDLPIPPSPKLTYNFAHFLEIDDLRSAVLSEVQSQLAPADILPALLDSATLPFDEYIKRILEWALTVYQDIDKSLYGSDWMQDLEVVRENKEARLSLRLDLQAAGELRDVYEPNMYSE